MKLGSLSPFLRHLEHKKANVAAAFLFSLGVSALNLAVPLLFKELTDGVLVNESSEQERLSRLPVLISLLITAFLARRLFQSLASYLAVSATQAMALRIRQQIYGHLHRLRLEFFDNQKTGMLVSNVTNDVTSLQYLLHDAMVQIFTAPVTVVGAMALVFYLDPILGWITISVFPLLYLVVSRTRERLRHLNDQNQRSLSNLTTLFLEAVVNLRIVRAFHRQEHELARFDATNEESLRLRLQNAALNAMIEFLTEITILVGFAAVLWIVGYRVATGAIKIDTVIALIAFLQTMRSSLTALSIAYTRYQQARGAAQRLLDILEEPEMPPRPSLTVAGRPASPFVEPDWRGGLTLEAVDFAYPDGHPILTAASLELRPGENVALVGESGVGKSTLASLILGLYPPRAGRILLDGVELETIPPAILVSVVSIVPQDVGLFSGTIRENIAYARLDATDEEIRAAARAANADRFIERLPSGYDTFIGDQGVKLSGGQKQRMGIARAILRNPKLLILDEATSHIDPETEALVQEALQRLMAERTTLIIAHQHSALRGVDRVITLREGQFIELAGTRPPG